VIAKRMNMFIRISGGVSSQLVARDFREALQDEEVESILLSIDSPAGMRTGPGVGHGNLQCPRTKTDRRFLGRHDVFGGFII